MWRFCIAIIILLCTVQVYAQTFPEGFEVFTTDDGLPDNYIWSILQDRSGLIWLGTSNGLCLYDGYSFTKYGKESVHDPFLSSKITRLKQDLSGKLWLATEESLGLFDPYSHSFVNFKHNPQNPNSLSYNELTDIHVDRKNRVWISTKNGLNRYIPQKQGFDRYFFSGNPSRGWQFGYNVDFIYDIAETPDGKLLIATEAGVVELDPDSGAFKKHTALANIPSLRILCDSRRRVWVKANNGLLLYDLTRSASPISLPFLNSLTVSSNIIEMLELDSRRLLIGLQGNGLVVLDTETLKVIEHIDHKDLPSSSFITSLYKDRTGVLWIGTETGGLIKYTPYRNRFKLYRSDPRNPNSLSDNMVRGIVVDSRKRLWVATQVGGLNVYDPATGLWKTYKHNKDDSKSLPYDNISSLMIDRKGQLWVATRHKPALCRLLPDENGFDCIMPSQDADVKNFDSDVNQIFQDSSGTIWVGTIHGLRRLERRRLPLVFRHNLLDIQSIYEDADGMLWIGSARERLIAFDPRELRPVRKFKNQPSDPESLSHNFVTSITEDRQGRLIVTTKGGGVNICTDRIKGKFKRLGVSDGLPHQNIYACLEDRVGDLWFSSDMGLCRYTPNTGKSYIFTRKDGLQHNEFNRFSYYKSADGYFYFGGINGLNSFRPEDIRLNLSVPELLITKLTKLSEPTQLLIHPDTAEISLQYSEQYFTIEFITLDYAVPLRNRFRYRMEGLNEKWMDLKEGEHSVTFTGLQPGNYSSAFRAAIMMEYGATRLTHSRLE